MFRKPTVTLPEAPQAPVTYPDGVPVVSEGYYYLIKGGKKYRFFSERCFNSWNLTPLPGTDVSLSKHSNAGILGFRDGSLILNYADGKMYLISNSKRRQIKSPDVIPRLAMSHIEMVQASEAEINLHEDGEDLV